AGAALSSRPITPHEYRRPTDTDESARPALVARRDYLPDLSAQLPRLERRRHRRPAGHPRETRIRGVARRRGHLDIAFLQVADGGFRLRHRRLPRGRSDLRNARRLRPPG